MVMIHYDGEMDLGPDLFIRGSKWKMAFRDKGPIWLCLTWSQVCNPDSWAAGQEQNNIRQVRNKSNHTTKTWGGSRPKMRWQCGGTKSFFCFVFVFGRMQIRAAFMALQSKKFKEEIINFWKGCLFDMKIQNNIILVHRNDKILSYESWKTLVF